EISTEEGSKYMTLILKEGYHYEDLSSSKSTFKESEKMPGTKSYFDEYVVNIDISKLSNIDANEYKEDREMLSLKQLDYYTDSLTVPYNEFIATKAKNFFIRAGIKDMHNDSLDYSKINKDILQNYDSVGRITIVRSAMVLSKNSLDDIKGFKSVLKNKQKFLNVYNTEFHRRLAFSFACLVLFFIGAPLGSIIRKGGFGFPMIMAIIIFVIYFFISTFGRNMAHSSTITPILGGWLATIILLPLGLLLMKRATRDKGIFNVDIFLGPITNFFKKLLRIKEPNSL
ncbi:MAG: LptF/LptG family permease, partial [Aureibaculum sp.]